MLLVSGCSGGVQKKKPKKNEPPELKKLNTDKGSVTVRATSGAREPLWTVRWETARIEYGGENEISGKMSSVSGEMYENGQVANTFVADYAEAEKQSNRLTLTGHISVKAKEHAASMACEKLEWDGLKQLMKATGNVNLKSDLYDAGVFDILLASPTMNKIGTPDLFDKVNRN